MYHPYYIPMYTFILERSKQKEVVMRTGDIRLTKNFCNTLRRRVKYAYFLGYDFTFSEILRTRQFA